MSTKIKLGKEVVVSDPCYTIPTWCQIILRDVLPGEYVVHSKKHDCGDWGVRQSMLMVIHDQHEFDDLKWKEAPGTVGVDSGQAGIFSMETYRNDEVAERIGDGDYGPFPLQRFEAGDIWYEKMCSRTLGSERWGMYDGGVVSSSGFGDGSYTLYIAKKNRKIVGMCIDFCVEEEKVIDFEFYKDAANS